MCLDIPIFISLVSINLSQNSSVNIVMGYMLGSQDSILGVDKVFLFSIPFILALGPTQLPIQWVPGAPPEAKTSGV
jgi:hypothetical protein